MSDIIDLDVLAPKDLVFRYRDREYHVPGDIPVDTVFLLAGKGAELAESDDIRAQHQAASELTAILLRLFQERQPDLEELPFGFATLTHVVKGLLGLISGADTAGDDDAPAPFAEANPTVASTSSPSS